jgi:N utilization substance protein A
MKNEFILAFNEVLEEKQLPKEIILQALESAMVSAYRRSVNASNAQEIEAKVDPETGQVSIYAEKEVVEAVEDSRTEVSLEDARKMDPSAELGGMVIVESTPDDFGRVAAQTARQVIQQRIRDAERQLQLDYYQKQLGEIISGIVQAASSQGLTVGLEMRAEGNLARKDMIPGERFRIHDRARALVAEVKDSPRGPQINLSRTHRDFLRRLLENEVPEIYHGIVEIRSIAREPGERAKVAVSATQSGIDPVGACVGIRGVRIQAIVRELHDEKIDVIEWNPDPVMFIAKAISPARVTGVYLSEHTNKTATVVVPEDQLSLAIGRDGQNARLAAKLTGWRIDIKSLSEATSDAIMKLQSEPQLKAMAKAEEANIDQVSEMLAKKAEGRPLTPEEYDQMAQFTDRVEKKITIKKEPEKVAAVSPKKEGIRALVPEEAFNENLLDSSLPEHVANILQEAGFITTGDLVMQMKENPDEIFRLQGIGPKAMEAINGLVETAMPEPAVEEAPSEEAEELEPKLVGAEVEEEVQEIAEEEAPQAALPAEEIEEIPQEEVPAEAIPAVEQVEEISEEEAVAQGISEEEETVEEETEAEGEEEPELSFEELFTLKTVPLETEFFEDEEPADSDQKSKKKKKKKKRFTEIEYDPDEDRTIVHKKHKREEDGEWDWNQ